tara:strand:- start:1249 stop:1503 length:255 start_codon:yes stop_codon:yes gene_type:complete
MNILDTEIQVEIPVGSEDSKTITLTALFDDSEPWFWGVEINGRKYNKQDLATWFKSEILSNLVYDMTRDDIVTDNCLNALYMEY